MLAVNSDPMLRVRACAAIFALLGGAALAAVFEVKSPAGIAFRHENSPTSHKYLIEAMGGGVALLDYNNDGLLDIFFVNSGQLAETQTLPAFGRASERYWNRLYRQNKDGSYTDVTVAAGLSSAGDGNYGMGAATADYDNDGFTDLYVTGYGRNVLYRNSGNGTFTDVTVKADVASPGWSVSAGFFDYDNDGRLDLFVTRYMEWDIKHSKSCGTSPRFYCSPSEFPAVANALFRNLGNGAFEDVTQKTGIAAKKGKALGVAFADYDADGFPDIVVANDGMEQFLFHNDAGKGFTERGLEAGIALTDDGKRISGMGVDFRDFDNDGDPDIIITDLARQNYALYRNDGHGLFSYRSMQTGVTALTNLNSGWGVGFVDFDNDGWKDLFAAQSHVMDNVEGLDASLHYLEPPLLALNHAGRFERADSGTTVESAGRGAAFGDLDNDGGMDVVMTVLGGKPQIFHNRKVSGHWLTLKLRGTRSNRDGQGAQITAGKRHEIATTAGSYVSANDPRVHLGLGTDTTTDIEILWPSGTKQKLTAVAADQILTVTEPEVR